MRNKAQKWKTIMKPIFKVLKRSILILLLLVWYDQSRSFYCLSENQCVTVWKRLGNKCYIIPGKYYGILSPSDDYLLTSNTQYLTLYFSEKLPKKIIVRNQGSSSGKAEYKIRHSSRGNWEISEYSERYKLVIYRNQARKFSDVQETANYIDLDIKENYARDKTGRKLK